MDLHPESSDQDAEPVAIPDGLESKSRSDEKDVPAGGQADDALTPVKALDSQGWQKNLERSNVSAPPPGAPEHKTRVRVRAIAVDVGDSAIATNDTPPAPNARSEMPDGEAPALDPGFVRALVDGLAGEASISSEDEGLPGILAGSAPGASREDCPPTTDIRLDFEDALVAGLPDGTSSASADLQGLPVATDAAEPSDEADSAASAGDTTTIGQPAGGPSKRLSSSLANQPLPGISEAHDPATAAAGVASGKTLDSESVPAGELGESPTADDAVSPGLEIDTAPEPLGEARDGHAAALAFAVDPATEAAFREGLLDYAGPVPDADDPQVWSGGLHAALAAFADGSSTRLVIVDVDGIAYPAGALHELAEVCEIGTVVIAVGSDDSARASREILLAGVADYLVKPIDAEAIREAVARATAPADDRLVNGRAIGFTGTGGSGATTLTAATAVLIAQRGRYVSVLDLNRTFPAAAEMLDVDPSPGLDQLLEIAGKGKPDPQMLDGVRSERTDRIAVFAYRWSPSPAPVPNTRAVDWLLGELRHRSQVVLVDGLDDPRLHFVHRQQLDAHALVVEPTLSGAARTARLLDAIGDRAPTLLVQNHTRKFGHRAGRRLLRRAGIRTRPDAVIPFEPSLPEAAYRGWPKGLLPRRVRSPLTRLADRLLVAAFVAPPGASGPARKP